MSRFYGLIGFVETQEIPEGSGIWVEVPTERKYRGEVSKFGKRWNSGDKVNSDLTISNTISIVADPYVSYLRWLENYWEISNVDIEPPRLILTLGGLYNGPTVGTSSDTDQHPRFK